MASSYFLSPLGIRSLYFAFAFSLFPPDNSRIAIIYYIIYIYIYIYILRRVYYIDLNVISEVESKSILLNHNKIVNKSRDTI